MEKFIGAQTELVSNYFNHVLKPLLPNVSQCSSMAFGQDTPNQIEISPSLKNGDLQGSQYEYKNQKLKFIHYTSLESAINIIKRAKMWMFSLASMKDPQELSHAINNIIPDKSDFTIDTYKNEVFSLSMNEFQDEIESLETCLQYGKNGNGIGLVLRFPKEFQNDWHQHYLSKIHYNDKYLEALHGYHIRHTDFLYKNNIKIVGQVKNFMLPLAAFHKTNRYWKENEVRFIAVNKGKSATLDESNYYTNHVINKSYIELELNPKFEELYHELRPIPKIEKIILGPKLIETAKLKEEFEKSAKDNLGYEVEVIKSKLEIN